MGVHGLWSVLAPAGCTLPLSRLAGRTLAVDLSGWVCQALTTKGMMQTIQKPHLRNLFYRVSTFYRLGANLVFVIDGDATQLKWITLDQRSGCEERRDGGRRKGHGERGERKSGRRPQLQRYVTECCNLLDCLGVPYIKSQGEAEALCSILNYTGVADGVLTNDSDAFLYGAHTVYRDLTTTERDAHVECYTMKAIHDTLALNRSDLIGLALLLGCDYCPEGVVGVGKEKAVQFMRACKSHSQSIDVLEQFRTWRNGTTTESDLNSKIEQAVYRKAMVSATFPQEEVIREFMSSLDTTSDSYQGQLSSWTLPRLQATQMFCRHHMDWDVSYTAEKMYPLITQWAIREALKNNPPSSVTPSRIVKKCKLKGEACYHVQWESITIDTTDKPQDPRELWCGNVVTIEQQEMMEQAFPVVCEVFRDRLSEEMKMKSDQKAAARALGRQHKSQKRVSKSQTHSKKSPIQTSPTSTLHQVLENMALKSPSLHSRSLNISTDTTPHTSTLCSSHTSISSDGVSLAVCSDTLPSSTIYLDLDNSISHVEDRSMPMPCLTEKPLTTCASSGLHESSPSVSINGYSAGVCSENVLQSSVIDLDSVSDVEEEVPCLTDRLQARRAVKSNQSKEDRLTQTTLLSPGQSVCFNNPQNDKVTKNVHSDKLNRDRLIQTSLLSMIRSVRSEPVSLNIDPFCKSLDVDQSAISPTEKLLKPRTCTCSSPVHKTPTKNIRDRKNLKISHSPKKLALTSDTDTFVVSGAPEPCIVLDDSDDSDGESTNGSLDTCNGVMKDDVRITSSCKGTKYDPIVV